MSLLFADQTEHYVVLVSDTLVTRGKDPFMFGPKVRAIPHRNMAIASTGSSNLAHLWEQSLLSLDGYGFGDIETVNNETPAALRNLYADLGRRFGEPLESSTIYHFGFPTDSDKLVRYVYRSLANFEPERFEGSTFTAKPLPADYRFERPQSQQEVIDLALKVREINDAQIADGGWGVRIGGELYATMVQNWNIQTVRWHRFADYDETAAAVLLRPNVGGGR